MKDTESYHFSSEEPPESISNSLQLTNRLDDIQYGEMVTLACDFLKKTQDVTTFQKNVEKYVLKHNMKLNPVQDMIKAILLVSKEASKKKLTPGQLFSDLQKLKQKPERASKLCQSWKKLSEENFSLPLDVTKRLVNLDWKFGVTASSSELERVGNCFVQIKMILSKGLSTENLSFEMSLHQFYDFMHQMEKAKLELDRL